HQLYDSDRRPHADAGDGSADRIRSETHRDERLQRHPRETRSMKPVLLRHASAVAACALLVLALGCSKKLSVMAPENARPSIRLTAGPIDSNAVCTPDREGKCYSITFDWVGYDVDGRVDHFLYAVDPPDFGKGDTTWVTTTDNEKRLVFP